MILPKYFSVDVDPGIAGRTDNPWAWPSKRALCHDLLRRGLLEPEADIDKARYAMAHRYDEPTTERTAARPEPGGSSPRAMKKIATIYPPKGKNQEVKA